MRGVLKYVLLSLCIALFTVAGNNVMAACTSHIPMPDTTSRTYRHTEAIKRLSIYRDTTQARQIWQEIVAADSTYSPALYYLSKIESDSNEALQYARKAFVTDTTNKWYTENYAAQLIAARQYTRAIPIYRRLMHLDPRNLQSYHALAVIYGSSGMPYSAIAILDSAELRNGYNYYLAEIKQHLLIDTRQFTKAIEEGRRRIEERPYDIEARRTLAMTYNEAGEDSLARATYEAAFRLDSTNIQTLEEISRYYQSKGNIVRMLDFEELIFRNAELSVEEKLHRLEQYTSYHSFYGKNYLRIGAIIQRMAIDHPNNRKVIDCYANHMIAGGDHEQALTLLRRHLANPETQAENYIYLLQFEHYLKREELIEEDLKEAMERFPEDVAICSFAGYIATEKEDYEGAIRIFKAALKHATDDEKRSELWGSIGDVRHEMGEDKAAFKAYKKALAYNPDNILVLNNYAYFSSLKMKNLERALEMSKRAMEAEPNNAAYVDTYAWILHLLGRNTEAKSYMRQALTISSQRDESLLCHYADILWALGEKFMAETYWQKAVERGYDKEEMERHIAEIKANTKQ